MPIDYSVLDDGPAAQKGSPEYKLIPKVQTSPEQDAIDAKTEAQPWVTAQLDNEIANTKDPKKLALLQEEKAKRDGPAPEIDYSSLKEESPKIDYSALQEPKGEGFRAYNRGVAAVKEVEDQTSKNQPKDWSDRTAGALGVVSGVPIGMLEFTASAIQNLGRTLKFPFTEKDLSDENLMKILSQPTVAQELHKMAADKYPMFDTGMSQVNAPFSVAMSEAGGLLSQGVEAMGASPVQGQLSEKALEIILGVLGARSMLKGKGEAKTPSDTPAADLKDILNQQSEAAKPTVPDQFEWDDGAARAENPLGDIQKTQANPNIIEPGLPRRMDEEGNLKPTKYDQMKDTEISDDPVQREIDAYKKRQEDEAWNQHAKEQEAIQRAQFEDDKIRNTPLDENYEPSQGSQSREKITAPISNRGPLARQRGAVDVSFLDPSGWFDKGDLAKWMGDISKVSTALFRKYGPDVDLGENRAGRYQSIQEGKGQLPVPHLELEKIGQVWTVVNHDGRHRSDMLLKAGEKDMPVRFKDDSGQFRAENPEQIRSQDMSTMMPNPWYDKSIEPPSYVKNPDGLYSKTSDKGIYDGSPRYDGRSDATKETERAATGASIKAQLEAKGYSFERDPDGGYNTYYKGEKTDYHENLGAALRDAEPNLVHNQARGDVKKLLGGVGKKQGGALDIGSLFKSKAERAEFEKSKAIVGRVNYTAKEFMEKFPVPTKDMNARAGFASGPWRLKRELGNNLKDAEHAIHTLSFLEDSMHILKEQTERLIVEQVHPTVTSMSKFYGINNPVKFGAMFDTLKKDINIRKQMEKSPEAWGGHPETKVSPTIKDMTDMGMSPKSAALWSKYDAMVERVLWPQVLSFAEMKGLHPPERVPGWMPHFTQGSWKVRLIRQAEGENPKFLAQLGARSRGDAEFYQRALQKQAEGHDDVRAEIIDPTPGNDTAGMLMDLLTAKDALHLNKGMIALVEKAFEQASIGQLKNALERQKNPQALHQLDRVGRNDDFNLSPLETRSAFKHFMNVMEFIPSMNMRAKFLEEKLFPLQQAGYFANKGNLRDATMAYVGQFLRIPDTGGAVFDKFIKDWMIKKGFDPKIASNAISFSNGVAVAKYIYFKPSFYVVQLAQKVANQGLLWSAAAEQRLAGDAVGSPVGAIVKSAIIPSRLQKLSNGENLVEYAEKVGAREPQFVENVKSFFPSDPFAKAIDRYTRSSAFQTGYNFFRQNMPEAEALQAAARLTREINVDYSGELGKPPIIAKEGGDFLRPLGTFMQYTLHQMQMLSYQMSVLTRAGKQGNILASKDALVGLAHNLAMMGAMGGILGFPLAVTINEANKKLNEEFALDLPTATSLSRDIGTLLKKIDFKDEFANFAARTAEFGLLSQAPMLAGEHGYDVSSSARGPTVARPDEYPHFLQQLYQLGVLAIKGAQRYGVSKKEIAEQVADSPSVLKEAAMRYIQNGYDAKKAFEQVQRLVAGNGKPLRPGDPKSPTEANAPMPHDPSTPGDYQRTPHDEVMALAGMKSLGEQQFNHNVTLQNQRTKVMDKVNERLIQQFKENPDDKRLGPFLKEMANIYGDSPVSQGRSVKQIIQDIVKYQKEKVTTETERKGLGVHSIRSIGEWQRWQDNLERSLEKR